MKKIVNAVIGPLFCGIVMSQAADSLMTRQPGSSDGMDVWFGNASGYENGIRDGTLILGGGGGYEYDAYLRFDLSGLPQAANQAIVWLYKYSVNPPYTTTPISWYGPQTQWQTDTVGWNNQPTLLFLGDSATAPSSSSGWYWIDITAAYNQWRVGRSGDEITLNYGYKMVPKYTGNRFDMFYGSSSSTAWARPYIYVYYTPQQDDSKIKLKWPLSTPSYANRVVNQAFGVDWSAGTTCDGLVKKHNGTDFQASAGTYVYASEDGIVKDVHYDSSGKWAYNIVIEHNHPGGGKYTTVYWHVDNIIVSVGDFVPKAYHMADIADLTPYDHVSHFHFGIRIGAYDAGVSGTGGLPQTDCGGYPAFPAGFIDPNNTSNVLFQ